MSAAHSPPVALAIAAAWHEHLDHPPAVPAHQPAHAHFDLGSQTLFSAANPR
ncbi:MAG: hypothetical protein H0V92_12825 [Pseudonocardiales bacterium]|nr:hypothetical protein [Pseudonocardiales bacterium]